MASWTVREIIQRGGGAKALYARSKVLAAQRNQRPVAEKTIYSWVTAGIPERHWWLVMPVCDVTESDLHRANEELRRGHPMKRADEAREAA